MNLLYPYFSDEIVKALGWTFLHSLWIGALLCIVYLCTQWLLRHQNAGKRYLSGLLFQALMVLLVALAFAWSYNEALYFPTEASLSQSFAHSHAAELTTPAENISSSQISSWFTALKSSYFEKYHSLMVGLWMVGVLLYTLHYLGGYIYTGRLKKNGLAEPCEDISRLFSRLAERSGVKRQVRLMESLIIKSPLVIGYFKPVILIPFGLVSGLSAAEVEAILAHEIAHIRRHDFLVNILQTCVEIIFFFHPGIWIIGAGIRKERENCCDDLAVALNGDRVSLAKALAHAEEWRLQAYIHDTFALGFSGNKNSLLNRIKRIINNTHMKTQQKDSILKGNLLAVALIAGLCLATLTALKGMDYQAFQEPAKKKEKTKEKEKSEDKSNSVSKSKIRDKQKHEQDPAEPGEEPMILPIPHAEPKPALEPAPGAEAIPSYAVDFDWNKTVDTMPGMLAIAATGINNTNPVFPGMPPFPPAGAVLAKDITGVFAIASDKPLISPADTFDRDSTIRVSHEQFARQMEDFAREMAALQSELGKEMAARAAEMSRLASEMAQHTIRDGHEMSGQREMARHQREMAMEQEEMARHHAEMAREMDVHHREEMQRHDEEMRKHRAEMQKMEEELRDHERKAKAFEKDLKNELIRDGIITSGEARINLKINTEGLVVNGVKQSDEMYKKYRKFINKMWDSGFSTEPSDDDDFSLSFTY